MKTRLLLPMTLLAAFTLSACGGKSDSKPTQVVAKVNDGEISVHQINFVQQRTPNLNQQQLPRFRKEVLNRLVDQELLVQAALNQKLDIDPSIQQQLESARREILARAYLEKASASSAPPNQADIDDFFAKRPELFEKRKIYTFSEISLPGRPSNWNALEKPLGAVKSIAEASAVLKASGIELPVVNNVTRATEALPMDLVGPIGKLPIGEVVIYPRGQGIVIAQILGIKDAPVAAKDAKPVIEQFLNNQRRSEAVSAEVKRLKESAKITFVGEFAASDDAAKSSQPAAGVPGTAGPAVSAGSNGNQPPAGPNGVSPTVPSADAMEKGLSGLKR